MKYIKTVIVVIVYIVVILFAKNIWSMDNRDRSHPYGLDVVRNNKYKKGLEGEKYGVSVYWGLPEKTDKNIDHLNKIEWLSTSYNREVLWRKALVCSVILVPIMLLIIGTEHFLNIKNLFMCIPLAFMLFYLSTSHYNHHVNHYRSTYVKSHVRKLKRSLKLSSRNPIYEKI
jgi:hypothetical protein